MPKDQKKAIAIREQTIKIIAEEGFDGLSMNKIAELAGFSVATIYQYHANKEEMLSQILDEANSLLYDELFNDFEPEMDFADGLWLLWQNKIVHAVKYPAHFKYLKQCKSSPRFRGREERNSHLNASIGQFISAGIATKQIKNLRYETCYSLAFGALDAFMELVLQSNRKTALYANDPTIKEIFKNVMLSLKY